MISIFFLLLFAHTLSDFVLQTSYIFKLKVKNIWGVVLHSAIFFFCAILLTRPLYEHSFTFVVWLLAVTLSHIVIDKVKIIINRNIIQKEIIYFFLDQLLHIAAMATIFFLPFDFTEDLVSENSLFFLSYSYDFIKDWRLFIRFSFICSLAIYVSYAVEVVLYYYDRTVSEKVGGLKYNIAAMLYRVFVFILFISPFHLLGILPIVARYYLDKARLVYDKRRYIIENGIVVLLVIIYYMYQSEISF